MPYPAEVGVQLYSLDAQKRSATAIAIPVNTNTPFVWDQIIAEGGFQAYNTTTGTFTCPFTGNYTFTFRFNASVASSTRQMSAAAEIWNGSAWIKSEFSAVSDAVRSGEARQVVFVSTVRFPAGTQVRFPFWCESAVTITNITPVNSTGFTVPASRLMITGTAE
jgi:hypothetical protein